MLWPATATAGQSKKREEEKQQWWFLIRSCLRHSRNRNILTLFQFRPSKTMSHNQKPIFKLYLPAPKSYRTHTADQTIADFLHTHTERERARVHTESLNCRMISLKCSFVARLFLEGICRFVLFHQPGLGLSIH